MVEAPDAAGAPIPPLLYTFISGMTLLASVSYAGRYGLPILSPLSCYVSTRYQVPGIH